MVFCKRSSLLKPFTLFWFSVDYFDGCVWF
jgi:hypothetical protein